MKYFRCRLITVDMKFLIPLVILFTAFISCDSIAQEPQDTIKGKKVIVTTFDGRERIGTLLEDDGREILLLTETIGKVYIRKENITSIRPFSGKVAEVFGGDYRISGPFTTRYYLTTNSLPIKKNEDYAMIHIYGPEVHFSLTDRFSLGVMSTWGASPFVVAGKYTFPTKNEKVNFGIGTLAGSSGYLNTFRGYGGLHWGMVTFGDRMRNITLSAGYTYVQPGFENEEYVPGTYYWDTTLMNNENPNIPTEIISSTMIKSPVFSIAGVSKIGKRASFFFDSMVFLYSNGNPYQRTESTHQDPLTGQTIYTKVEEIENENSSGVVIIAMPGMRFQQKENRAFQFVLAGYTRIANNKVLAIPVPMCSWFFKF